MLYNTNETKAISTHKHATPSSYTTAKVTGSPWAIRCFHQAYGCARLSSLTAIAKVNDSMTKDTANTTNENVDT